MNLTPELVTLLAIAIVGPTQRNRPAARHSAPKYCELRGWMWRD